MAHLNSTFILGVFIVAYLSSFILFATIRILTGVSIQRIGYFCLKRLKYTPRSGIEIEIRGLGINLHRPNFAQPTWLSIALTEFAITIDLKLVENEKIQEGECLDATLKASKEMSEENSIKKNGKSLRSMIWKRLTIIKEKLKRLHRKINLIRLVDIVATNSSVTLVDVGTVQVGSFTMALDTRRKIMGRGRNPIHLSALKNQKQPAEWIISVQSVLLTVEGEEPVEILDHATLNISGLLYRELDGLRDASISLKIGRAHIPYDEIDKLVCRYLSYCNSFEKDPLSATIEIPFTRPVEDFEKLSCQEDYAFENFSESKKLISSVLRGVKEVQFIANFVGLTKRVDPVQPSSTPVYLNASMKEVGIDLHRLDQRSPAHRMYFLSKDIAHQALVAALSITIGIDDGDGNIQRLTYIPMATTTVRTTFPSKTVDSGIGNSADERNANILFANMVITSPSIDLNPQNLVLVTSLIHSRPQSLNNFVESRRNRLILRFLPKASIKFSINEPVIRLSLPLMEDDIEKDDFNLIISSIYSISLDIESLHATTEDFNYSLTSKFRLQSHLLYYQTASGARHELLEIESLELKTQISAQSKLCVAVTGFLKTCSIHIICPEIVDGVRQLTSLLRLGVEPKIEEVVYNSHHLNYIRSLPPWLVHFSMQGSDFSAEVGGIDGEISEHIQGFAIQLESWVAEYFVPNHDNTGKKLTRRRTISRSFSPGSDTILGVPVPERGKKQQSQPPYPADDRSLSIQIKRLEAFVIDSSQKWQPDSFLAVPKIDCTIASNHNPDMASHISVHIKSLLVHYSLYRHYACCVATMILRKVLLQTKADKGTTGRAQKKSKQMGINDFISSDFSRKLFLQTSSHHPFIVKEQISIDLKATTVQIKAQMPTDPAIMLQIQNLEVGWPRFTSPFITASNARVFTEDSMIPQVWARIADVRNFRADHQAIKCAENNPDGKDENFIDINTEAIRLAIPHGLIAHRVIDNFINTFKSVQQLHYRFATDRANVTPEKCSVKPMQLPQFSIRSKALLFELEDGAFEWKLGVIYRTGLVEHAQRLARQAAFDVKVRKIEEVRRSSLKSRNKSALSRDRIKTVDRDRPHTRSEDGTSIRSNWAQPTNKRDICYNPDGICKLTGSGKITVKEAYENLQLHNSRSWKLRIDLAFKKNKAKAKELRGIFSGVDELPEDVTSGEQILHPPQRPSLMGVLVSDLHIKIDNPSLLIDDLPNFIHRTGKGMPLDMQYALLIPMHVQIDMGELRVTLRDYPLPLIHVPSIKSSQLSSLPAWSLKADLVIAEEFRGCESTKNVKIDIIPPKNEQSGVPGQAGFAIDISRTISPIKSYSDIKVNINTGYPTHITWGSSFQPAIQDMMMIIETFTKPQIDPSDRTGFWDNIRLSFHSRVSVAWRHDGDVHLLLKGSRDPYEITGIGAGFLMCWRKNVRWDIHRHDDPKKFMTVQSGQYILAVPDLSHHARNLLMDNWNYENLSNSTSFKHGTNFKKIVMKLSGNVQWLAGLMFERNLTEPGKRSFEFKPHYEVVLKRPDCAKSVDDLPYDAFRGFRSNHIHLSVAIRAPMDGQFPISNVKNSESYNTVHLSPRFFSHFYAWWSMFGGTVSLPIRQGNLWPGMEKSNKKFARHIATIKYSLMLAPLFTSHIYKHNDAGGYDKDADSATGLKIKLDNLMLDVHQRREEYQICDKSHKTQHKTSGMKMHQAQLDLLSADIRAITKSSPDTSLDDPDHNSDPDMASLNTENPSDFSHFDISPNDSSWIDTDDFVELDWDFPSDPNLETKILPLAYAPRFTYFRQTEHNETIQESCENANSFGHEPTHFCIMTKSNDSLQVQYDLVKKRKKQLDKQMARHSLALRETQIRATQDSKNEALKSEFEQCKRHNQFLQDKADFLKSMMQQIKTSIDKKCGNTVPEKNTYARSDGEKSSHYNHNSLEDEISDTDLVAGLKSDYNNHFVIHNMQLKWNNLLRNIILRYIHQVSQRQGIIYYLSRRAVKFILDIVQEQKKPRDSGKENKQKKDSGADFASGNGKDPIHQDVTDRINEILSDAKKLLDKTDRESFTHCLDKEISMDNLNSNLSGDFIPMNSYQLHLIAPQIQLQSEKNPTAVVLVTAKGMEAKVIEVMDKACIWDNITGLVQRRFSVEMDSIQFFVTHQNLFSSQLLSMYSGSRYGAPFGSVWPPWVPLEVMFDFKIDPFGFKRVVQKTLASLRYDNYNTLRLKYTDEISSECGAKNNLTPNEESRMDRLWVEFPKIHAICNSAQYYAMYIIVMDLLMYSEPQEKTRNERLEKIILASDFSDLRGVPEMVITLQERIRRLEELRTYFQINARFLDEKSSADRLLLYRDLNSCASELFFLMKAITTSQRKYDVPKANGLLRWSISSQQIVWHLIRDSNEPLLEFQLRKAEYDRIDNSDGSHINVVQVGKITGLNLLPDAIYPQIFAPYFEFEGKTPIMDESHTMLKVYWYMLEAIAGIPVMDHFEVKLVPIKIQLERDIGKKLFDYIFPDCSDGKGLSPLMAKNMQPLYEFNDENDDDSSDVFGESDFFSSSSTPDPSIRSELLEPRAKPISNPERYPSSVSYPKKTSGILRIHYLDGNNLRIFQPYQKPNPSPRGPLKKSVKTSVDIRPQLNRSISVDPQFTTNSDSKGKRFSIPRYGTKAKNEQSSDDLTKMMGRASSYMTLAYVKIPSVVLCLSYKGKGERNLEDIHDLVFRLPDIEYRNKTWSNLDLALALKRDVIRSLISHTGAIVANKFKHRPSIAQQHRSRELATNSLVLIAPTQDVSYENSDGNSSLNTCTDTNSRNERSCNSRQNLGSIKKRNNLISRDLNRLLKPINSVQNGLEMISVEADNLNECDKVAHINKSNEKSGVFGRFMKKNDGASMLATGKSFNHVTDSKQKHIDGSEKKGRRSLKTILGNGSG